MNLATKRHQTFVTNGEEMDSDTKTLGSGDQEEICSDFKKKHVTMATCEVEKDEMASAELKKDLPELEVAQPTQMYVQKSVEIVDISTMINAMMATILLTMAAMRLATWKEAFND